MSLHLTPECRRILVQYVKADYFAIDKTVIVTDILKKVGTLPLLKQMRNRLELSGYKTKIIVTDTTNLVIS